LSLTGDLLNEQSSAEPPSSPPHSGPLPPTGEGDDGEDDERGPLRRCIVTRERGPRDRMIRFVLGPDRMIVPDLLARLPGRGMWLSARADVVEAAARGAFARAARGPVILPPELATAIRAGLTRRVTDLLGLARRAGQAVGGYSKAREALVQKRVGVVVQAVDGSDEECLRLMSGAQDVPVVRPLAASALGAVFGRDHLVHVAIAPGRLADGVIAECFRLAGMATPVAGINNPMPKRRRGAIERTGE
jgi:predicted RNA-binding protein YlxR (DUF448 family)